MLKPNARGSAKGGISGKLQPTIYNKGSGARKDQECKDAGIQLLRIDERDYGADPEAVKQKILKFLSI